MIQAGGPATTATGCVSSPRDSSPPLSRFRARLFGSKSSPRLDLCSCRAQQWGSSDIAAAAAATFRSAAEDISEQGEELLAYAILVELLRSGVRLPPTYLDGLPRTPYGEYSFKWRSITLLVIDDVERLRCDLRATVDRMVDRLTGETDPETAAPDHFRKVLVDTGVAGYPLPSRIALVLLFSARLAVDTCCRFYRLSHPEQQQQEPPLPLHPGGKPGIDGSRGVDAVTAAEAATDASAAALASLHAEAWESVRLQLLPEVTAHGGWMQAMLSCECQSKLVTSATSSVISRGLAFVGPVLSALALFIIWLRRKAFQLEGS